MGNERDVFEWRRYGHWDSTAAKARLSAYVLWQMYATSQHTEFAAACGHVTADAGPALLEAFRRESAVALELVIKAVIARKLRNRHADPAVEGIPATHDLPRLWQQAELPKLDGNDQYRLQLGKSVLMWAGRYPTPRSVKAWEDETKEFSALERHETHEGRFSVRTPITMGWDEFECLYQIAVKELALAR